MLNRIFNTVSQQPVKQIKSNQVDPQFKNNEFLEGKVIKRLTGNTFLLTAKGRQFQAYSRIPLGEGNKYYFQVKTLGSHIELKVLENLLNKTSSSTLTWPSDITAADKLIKRLKDISGFNTFKGLSKETVMLLKNIKTFSVPALLKGQGEGYNLLVTRNILGGGLFWESKIIRHLLTNRGGSWKGLISSDLKGLLLQLQKKLEGENQAQVDIKSLAIKVKHALTLIEQEQLLNISTIKEGLGWLFHLYGLPGESFKNAELFIKKRNKNQGLFFSVLLELSQLGNVEFNVSLIESVLGLNIKVEDNEKVDFMRENIPMLEESLKYLGITIGNIACETGEIFTSDSDHLTGGYEQPSGVHLII